MFRLWKDIILLRIRPFDHLRNILPFIVSRILEAGGEGFLSFPDQFSVDGSAIEHQLIGHTDNGRGVQSTA